MSNIHSTFNEVVNLRKKKNIIKYCITCVQVVHIIIKFFLRYNNITIVYLPYAIYFSTFKNTVFISSPGPKVHVNYCHHLASVVCKLFTFQASSPKPLGRLEPNLAGMSLGWSSTKLLFFVPVGYSIWLPGTIICSDWLKFQRSSSLKLMN